MNRVSRRTNAIWFMTKDQIEDLIKNSRCMKEVVRNAGIKPYTRNVEIMRLRISEYGIDISDLEKRGKELRLEISRKSSSKLKIPLSDILIEKSTYSSSQLKDRLFREGLLKNKCSECGLENEWNGKTIYLHMDHVNGHSDDNRIDNLRILCPNCHSQTETYCKRNFAKRTYTKTYIPCPLCGKRMLKYSKACSACKFKIKENRMSIRRHLNRPTLEAMRKASETLGYRGAGRMYGVSAPTIKKWMAEAEFPPELH